MKYPRDYLLRLKLFSNTATVHRAKLNLYLLDSIMERNNPGIVVDPFGGIGSLYLSLEHGFFPVLGDIESHFTKIAKSNMDAILTQSILAHMQKFNVIPPINWDAKNLPLPADFADLIVTSPPYGDTFSNWHIKSNPIMKGGHEKYGDAYGVSNGQIGNIHVHENYLRAMRDCYLEARRVLKPESHLVVILANNVRGKKITPIVENTITLLNSLGFGFVDRSHRTMKKSFYGNINALRDETAPVIDKEWVLTFKKGKLLAPKQIAIVQEPNNSYQSRHVAIMDMLESWKKEGRISEIVVLQDEFSTNIEKGGFRKKKELAFGTVENLITTSKIKYGSKVFLFTRKDYETYYSDRLETFGIKTESPLRGLNYGKSLKWIKERIL